MYSHLASVPLIGSLTVEHFQLANGLQVAIVNDPTTPIFSYQTWFKVGSADEPAGKQGLAHLFEHMMFRKTKNREMGEWEREVNINGGTGINAYTSRDQTVYFFTFPNNKIDLAASLESDRMTNLMIEHEMFETEKGAVLTERNRNVDNPGRYLWDELYQLRYVKHNYRYSIIGEEKSIKNFTVQEAENFYQTYYSPANALIIIVGSVDPYVVMKTVAQHYSKIHSAKIPVRQYIVEPKSDRLKSLSLTHHKAMQKMMAKAWLTDNMLNDDYAGLWIVGKLLAGNKTSILHKRLVNSAKARNVHAEIFVGKDNGTFEFYAEIPEGEKFDVIDSVVMDAFENLASGKIDNSQLQIVKNMIEKEYYMNITSSSSLARLLGDGFIYANDLRYQLSVMELLKKVTIHDVQRIVEKYLINGKDATVYLEPTKNT